MQRSTRERIVAEALRLFAERGYAATSVAEIEAAAGLSPGAGGLYRHFRSKEEVLAAAVREHIARTSEQIATIFKRSAGIQDQPLADRLSAAASAGLAKMREEADLIRVLFRDLDKFPNLVAEMREGIANPLYDLFGKWLAGQPEMAGIDEDWDAVALTLGGAIVNYWLAQDALYAAPNRIDEERFINGWSRLAMGLVGTAAEAVQ
ncbi:helix-turn-helix domain-containing protein [Actinoallomurus sp. NPDC050550]|uniref:TetR/AcrR family transcriptional regulator n=1 Tax=Actinoallomurus sp. NPDC050550 TaxID=3154937 RepID=UPI0033D11FFA